MRIFIFTLIFIFFSNINYANNINFNTAKHVAENHILLKGEKHIIKNSTSFYSKNNQAKLFYLFNLSPKGYIVVTTNELLTPIIAYSFLNNIDKNGKLVEILTTDINLRLKAVKNIPKGIKLKNKTKWTNLLNGTKSHEKGQIWPPTGTTSTGGWLESNWTQNSPYNNMCPMDTVTSTRSYAGCPAVAMAMIVNYHKTTNNVYFDNSDDYYHNYAGRKYSIDDDYAAIDFPSFPQLNNYLDTLKTHYQYNINLTNNDKAALVFASAVACKQVFTSGGSGTFGVSQAYTAYQKFNFNNFDILYSGDTSLYTRLIANMKAALPAHLALVDSNMSSGHNIVVDGYDSQGYFHLNFGWGGNSNGWYVIPDSIPYNLTVIEGLILDIAPDSITKIHKTIDNANLVIYPNPTNDVITIKGKQIKHIEIINLSGNIVKQITCNNNIVKIDMRNHSKGIYFVRVISENKTILKKIVLN